MVAVKWREPGNHGALIGVTATSSPFITCPMLSDEIPCFEEDLLAELTVCHRNLVPRRKASTFATNTVGSELVLVSGYFSVGIDGDGTVAVVVAMWEGYDSW